MKKPETVFVRNNGTQPHTDRYDGEDFTISPGEAVEMEVHCARLCFGFQEEDKRRVIQRLGWSSTSADYETAVKRLNGFSFHLSAPVKGGEKSGAGKTTSDDSLPVDGPAPINALTKLSRAVGLSAG
jgi:hypothetical protein